MGWWITLGIIGLTYVLVLFAVSYFGVHPFRIPLFLSPGSLGTTQENVTLTTVDGVRLQGWWLDQPDSECAVILCHGYMMNRSEPAPVATMLWKQGISCLMFDFRAHGKSGGKNSGLGYTERLDVKAAYEWVRANHPGKRISIYGSSMGAAASSLFCSEHPGVIDALILDSAYSRLLDAITGWWRFVGGNKLALILYPSRILSRLFLDFKLKHVDIADALEKIGSTRVLIVHGDVDNLATPAGAERNFAAINGEKKLVWFEGCGHSEGRWNYPKQFNEEVIEFIALGAKPVILQARTIENALS